MENKKIVKAKKAYDNSDFLHSRDGRVLRILAEYLHPEQKFRKQGIRKTIIFFGSARIFPEDYLNKNILRLENEKLIISNISELSDLEKKISNLRNKLGMSRFYEEARMLAFMLTEWSMKLPKKERYNICTGGGPGIMEAANRGANEAGGKTIGLNISLPFEQEPNPYIDPELNFEFHYFFMRKFWLVYLSQVLIIFPGGFGTIDEMMEILTLRQTGKMKHPRMIFLYSEDYWKNIINFEALASQGMIDYDDLSLFKFVNSPEEAFNSITNSINIKHHKEL